MKLKDFDFRIWSVKKEKYLDELYSNIISLSSDKSIKGYNRNYKILAIEFSPYDSIPLMNDNEECFEIELFTGFCDKNNKKIYEGDILKIKEDYNKTGKGFVQYHKGIFKIINKKSSHEYCVTYLGYILCRENIEIIGNIHENSELIKEIE
ncbi:hypothetical protein E2J16_07975 [Campylobacter coli]|nr:hypothetical protein [Campylobacter coli]ECW7644253.1 hypothetical protein [Campylobacter coli]